MRPIFRFPIFLALLVWIAAVNPGRAQSSPRAADIAYNSPPEAGHVFNADRGYYAMVNGALEKWDFHRDGTFLHEGVAAGAGTSVRNSARGTYRIQGNVLILRIGNTATAFATPGSSSSMIGGGASSAGKDVRMKIELLGADGSDGVVLNGTTFHIRHGW